MVKQLNYNMAATYCSDWSVYDALREIAQNAIDSDPEFCEFIFSEDGVSIESHDNPLMIEHFCLGFSDKPEESIGQFGEGMKIALLVLARAKLLPYIHSGYYLIRPEISYCDTMKVDTFKINIDTTEHYFNGVDFFCKSYDVKEEELIKRINWFSKAKYPTPTKDSISTLPGKPGLVYVNGLLVEENSNLGVGYNFHPSQLSLNRDRNTSLGITWTLGELYAKYMPTQKIFELLIQDAYDVQDVRYWLTSQQQAELKELFLEKYGKDMRVTQSGSSTSGAISFSYSTYSTFAKAGVAEPSKRTKKNSPTAEMYTFYVKNKKHMRRNARQEFEQLLEVSETWT